MSQNASQEPKIPACLVLCRPGGFFLTEIQSPGGRVFLRRLYFNLIVWSSLPTPFNVIQERKANISHYRRHNLGTFLTSMRLSSLLKSTLWSAWHLDAYVEYQQQETFTLNPPPSVTSTPPSYDSETLIVISFSANNTRVKCVCIYWIFIRMSDGSSDRGLKVKNNTLESRKQTVHH